MKKKLIVSILIVITIVPLMAYTQAISDYLILQDIGPYQIDKPKKHLPGEPPWGGPQSSDDAGVLSDTGHFPDHTDRTYEVMYLGGDNYASPTITVTQHAGVDSDKWLAHEMEVSYRSSKSGKLGLVLMGASVSTVGGYKVFLHGIGGGGYTWLSNNNVIVDIEYTSLAASKPKPTEIVQAYLARFPSVIPATFKLNSAHDVEWIKDEMDRRLWLCDKWVAQIQPQDAALYNKLNSVVNSMNVFLDYREKYFGLAAKNERLLLQNYLSMRNAASIETKLQKYKDWWTANKSGSIMLP